MLRNPNQLSTTNCASLFTLHFSFFIFHSHYEVSFIPSVVVLYNKNYADFDKLINGNAITNYQLPITNYQLPITKKDYVDKKIATH